MEFMVDSILIYGEGFVGSSLYEFFRSQGKNVLIRRLDTSSSLLKERKFLTDNNIQVIVNTTWGSSVGKSVADPLRDFDSNVKTVMYLKYLLENVGLKIRLVHFSSAAVYGEQASDIAEPALSPYARHKVLAEDILTSSIEQSRLCIVRPFSIYGVNMTKQVVWDTFNKLNIDSEVVEFYGSGKEIRSFIYMTDVCSMLEVIVKNKLSGCYDLHGIEEVSIDNLVTMIADIVGYKGVIRFNGIVDDMSPRNLSVAVCEKIDIAQRVSLKSGLKNIYHWKLNQ